jgi:NAD(P)-dependent dehydrogenase (short-subunit alcohol dehydrogenase family)
VKYVQLDITDIKSVHKAKEIIEKAEGKLDVLVNNAGKSFRVSSTQLSSDTDIATIGSAFMFEDKGTIVEDLSILRQGFEVNFFGTIQTTVAFLPLIRKAQKGYGVIEFNSTNMASNTHMAGPDIIPQISEKIAYNSSKAALNSYVIALARKLKEEDTGIKVNSVTPGFTTTKLNGFYPGGNTTEAAAQILLPYALLGPEDSETTGKGSFDCSLVFDTKLVNLNNRKILRQKW